MKVFNKSPLFLIFVLVSVASSDDFRDVFDQDLYASVLDSELCQHQLDYLSRDPVALLFLDASAKPPTSISQLNLKDYGDYLMCLSIKHEAVDLDIEGKYCMVRVLLGSNTYLTWPGLANWSGSTWPSNETIAIHEKYENIRRHVQTLTGFGQGYSRIASGSTLGLNLGICVPKACTATEALDYFSNQVPFLQIEFEELFCRLPNDKPFSTADLVAAVIFSIIAGLTVLSTSYDLHHTFQLKSPSKNQVLTSFSVYTNTRRFLTFNKVPGAVECLDGIRAISMLWVIVGHSYSSTVLSSVHNYVYAFEFMQKFSTVWLHAAPFCVDTFFMLSGILCVYTTIGKTTQYNFIKNIPLFYLHRFLRMFPILAVTALFCVSFIHHSSDGPEWSAIANVVHTCRKTWWTLFIFLQNYVRNKEICIGHTWYLSVDFQLYVLSPLVLICLFGRQIFAWFALAASLLTALAGSSYYSYYYNFSAAIFGQTTENYDVYMKTFYINTLPRASPFCVGLIYGYILHLLRDKDLILSRMISSLLWLLSFGMMAFSIFIMYPVLQTDFENQVLDNFLNAYMRTIWALALGWLIVACAKGYGGPINWFLSHEVWKLPARLSYAMYLIHYLLIFIANDSWMKPHYFTNEETLYRFTSDLTITVVFSLLVCILVDAPCTTLQKLLLSNPKGHQQKTKTESRENFADEIVENNNFGKTRF